MKEMIEIQDDIYKAIVEKYETFPADYKHWGLEAIKNGTPVQNDSEEASNRWIPVTESLPEDADSVLVTYQGYDIPFTNQYFVDVAWFLNGQFTHIDQRKKTVYGNVTAWMPLPAPYKKEGDENE